MGRAAQKLIRLRHGIQAGFFALTNSYIPGWLRGGIYQGTLKTLCVPDLNCYSCPGALGACPIGAMQAVLNNRGYKVAYYGMGFLLLTGAFLGRAACGRLCPFGLVQDLIYKIPAKKKRRVLPFDRVLRYAKYAILALVVLILPMFATGAFGVGVPWFCKYICPSGTLLAGWPPVILHPALGDTLGGLLIWKNAVLGSPLVLSVFFFRPFCRYLCPLGAVYGWMNPIAVFRFSCDAGRCTRCGACRAACPGDIKVYEKPNSPECIRCGANPVATATANRRRNRCNNSEKQQLKGSRKMAVLELTNENFETEVLKSDKPVLVDFWAQWCGPCRMLSPVVDEVAEEVEQVKFCKLNVDEANEIARKYSVMSIPTLILFKEGQIVSQSVGVLPKNKLLDFVANA